jgi:hypothetical protein
VNRKKFVKKDKAMKDETGEGSRSCCELSRFRIIESWDV